MALPMDKTSANKLTVVQLKKELELRAIDYGAEGLTKKQQLIQRLIEVQNKEQNKSQSENKKQSQELPQNDHNAAGENEKIGTNTQNSTEQHGKSAINVNKDTIVNEEENDDIRIVKAVKLHENASAEQVELVKTLIKRVEKFGAAFKLSDNDRQQLRIIKFGKSSNAGDAQKSSNSVVATTSNDHKVDAVSKGKKRIIVNDVQEDEAVIAARAAKFGLLPQSHPQPSKKQHNGVNKNDSGASRSVDMQEQALRVARAARFGQPSFPLGDDSHVAETTTPSHEIKGTSS